MGRQAGEAQDVGPPDKQGFHQIVIQGDSQRTMTLSPKTCYLICASHRSGSSLLKDYLADTGLAGNPQEYFNPWHMGHAKGFPKELVYDRAYVQELIKEHTTPNGVFGVKAHFTQIINFVGLGRLEDLFPTQLRYIYVQRRDDVRQAVSLARAVQTDQWGWEHPAAREPVYNFFQILCCLREVRIQEKGWKVYFLGKGIEPFQVVYEDFVAAPEPVVLEVLRFLDIVIPEDFQVPPPRLRKQADQLSEEWVTKFQAGIE
jgi:LPS sulfotransferase NodH